MGGGELGKKQDYDDVTDPEKRERKRESTGRRIARKKREKMQGTRSQDYTVLSNVLSSSREETQIEMRL